MTIPLLISVNTAVFSASGFTTCIQALTRVSFLVCSHWNAAPVPLWETVATHRPVPTPPGLLHWNWCLSKPAHTQSAHEQTHQHTHTRITRTNTPKTHMHTHTTHMNKHTRHRNAHTPHWTNTLKTHIYTGIYITLTQLQCIKAVLIRSLLAYNTYSITCNIYICMHAIVMYTSTDIVRHAHTLIPSQTPPEDLNPKIFCSVLFPSTR